MLIKIKSPQFLYFLNYNFLFLLQTTNKIHFSSVVIQMAFLFFPKFSNHNSSLCFLTISGTGLFSKDWGDQVNLISVLNLSLKVFSYPCSDFSPYLMLFLLMSKLKWSLLCSWPSPFLIFQEKVPLSKYSLHMFNCILNSAFPLSSKHSSLLYWKMYTLVLFCLFFSLQQWIS